MKHRLHALRLLPLLFLIWCLTISSLPAQAGQESSAKETFNFGKVDLALLEQANLFDAKLAKEGLVYDDKELEAYVTRVGKSLLDTRPAPQHVQWRFRVLRDPMANAFALPNGSIYIHSGLLALLDNESQLAGILAHEITHVENRHSYLLYRSMRKKALAINLLAAAAAFSPAGTAGTIIAIAASVSQQLLVFSIFGYSREAEREADRYATNYLLESNYDPRELVTSFKLLKKDFEGEDLGTPIFYRDHDKLDDRIKYVSQIVAGWTLPPQRAEAADTERAQYLAATERVVRHNTYLAINGRRFRTAVALSEKLVANNPNSSENLRVLADAYRAIGPRAPVVPDQELSKKEKKDLQKFKTRLTLEEEENKLLATPAGSSARQDNQRKAEDYYQKALAMDEANAEAHLGLGLLYEGTGRPQPAIVELRKFLELRPNSADRQRVLRRLEALEKKLSPQPPNN